MAEKAAGTGAPLAGGHGVGKVRGGRAARMAGQALLDIARS
jgi:hypothetical protein